MSIGDHLYVHRGGYSHHGIDCGDGTVIHYSGEPGKNKSHASICRASMADFLRGAEAKVRRYGYRFDAAETVARAESRLDECGYRLVFNNCEHFARWCCTDRSSSDQVNRVVSGASNTALLGGAAVVSTSAIASAGVVGGVSAAGIMSGLAASGSLVGGGAAVGPVVIGAAPAAGAVVLAHTVFADDVALDHEERQSRRDARIASVAGAAAGAMGGVAAISAAGTTGLSAVGISSGLATIGGAAGYGGGMLVGAAAVAVAPATVAVLAAGGVYAASRMVRWLFAEE